MLQPRRPKRRRSIGPGRKADSRDVARGGRRAATLTERPLQRGRRHYPPAPAIEAGMKAVTEQLRRAARRDACDPRRREGRGGR